MDEPDADGRVLLRPRVPFRTRRAALEQMAQVVRAAPPVTRPREELTWVGEPRGQDLWQTPEETEQLGMGDCEDLEIYAARQDLDDGADGVALCMSVTARRNEHVFGMRGGEVVDHSEAAGMPPLPPSVYERRVCVPVLHEEGERTMMMGDEIETGGPQKEVFDDYNIHGIAHWRSHAWEKAAATAAHRFPSARPSFVRLVPALKSAASYFSTLHLSAWDKAGNDAKVRKIKDAIWVSKRGEELARGAYKQAGGKDADFVLDFERRYGRPPTDRESVRAAVKALIFVSTAKTHPGYQKKLSKLLSHAPVTLTQAAIHVAVIAQGHMPPDAFPVPPHCPECTSRRKNQMPRVVEPEDINLTVIYNATNTNTSTATNTNTVASGQGAVASTQTNTASGAGSISAPSSITPPAPPAAPAQPSMAVPVMPVVAQPSMPVPAMPVVASQAAPVTVAAPDMMSPMFAGMFGGNPYASALAAGSYAPRPMAAAMTAPTGGGAATSVGGSGATSINNSGNVNLTVVGEEGTADGMGGDALGGGDVLGSGDGQSGGDELTELDVLAAMGLTTGGFDDEVTTGGPDGGGCMLSAMGLATGGPDDDEVTTGGADDDGVLAAMGLTTGGPDDDEVTTGGPYDDDGGVLAGMGLTTGGFDDDEVSTGGFDDDEVSTGGFDDDEVSTGGPYDDEVSTGGPDDDEVSTGGPDDDGVLAAMGLTTGGFDDDEVTTGGPFDDESLIATGGDDDGLLETGGWAGDDSLLFDDDGEDGDVEALLDIEPVPCSSGTCGLF